MGNKQINILDVIPVINEGVSINKGKEGEYTLSFPSLRTKGIFRFAVKWSKTKYIELDKTGTEVLKHIDGIHNIEEIIFSLADYFEYKNDYAARIIMFISGLKSQGIIKYITKNK